MREVVYKCCDEGKVVNLTKEQREADYFPQLAPKRNRAQLGFI